MTKRGGMGGRAHGYITKLERKMKEDKARKGRGKKKGGGMTIKESSSSVPLRTHERTHSGVVGIVH